MFHVVTAYKADGRAYGRVRLAQLTKPLGWPPIEFLMVPETMPSGRAYGCPGYKAARRA